MSVAIHETGTQRLTVKYLLTLLVLAALAAANYLILSAQIETNRAVESVVMDSGRQRSVLQRSSLLAQKLIITAEPQQRDMLRGKLRAIIHPLEEIHHSLIRSNKRDTPPPEQVRAIYFDSPWLLDTEMRNYIAQMQSLIQSPDHELNWGNPHIRYIDEAALSGKMVDALDEVVAAYQAESSEKTQRLQRLAVWSLASTVVVLALTGFLVFRPMVKQVRRDMLTLQDWNETLEQRVAQRTAEAEERAAQLATSEAALRNQTRILQSILDSMGDGVIVVDNERAFRLFNPAAREILGIDQEGGLPGLWNAQWFEQFGIRLYLPDGETPYRSEHLPLTLAVEGVSTNRAEVCLRRDDGGDPKWLSVTARPLLDNDGAVRGGVAVLRDFTDRKKSEQALKASEALYHSLVANLPLFVLRKDLDGRYTFVNEMLCDWMGRGPTQILGQTDDDFYPAELADKYRRDDRRVIETGIVYRDIDELRTPAGESTFVEVLKTPVRDSAGRVIETQTIFFDVTARVEAERRLVQSERLAAIGQMVTGVAHESRNALQQIQACSGLLEWKLDGRRETRELLVDLQKAQDRLHRLFENLRSYAAPMSLDRRWCDVRGIVAEAWAEVLPLRNGRDVSLNELTEAENTKCDVDLYKLEQVFRNIFENALAACDDPVVVEVNYDEQVKDNDSTLIIAVRDNGPGLTAEQQQKMFEPFFTTRNRGTGLGMSIAMRIVQSHGGEIEARNAAEGGAEILISLPRTRQKTRNSVAAEQPIS